MKKSIIAIFKSLSLENVILKINSIGDSESRKNYSKALKEYFTPYINDMCEDCKRRIETNPLRILDCKVDKEHKAFTNAPTTIEYLNEEIMTRYKLEKNSST